MSETVRMRRMMAFSTYLIIATLCMLFPNLTSTTNIHCNNTNELPDLQIDPPTNNRFLLHRPPFWIRYNITPDLLEYVETWKQEGASFYVGIVYDQSNEQLKHVTWVKKEPSAQYANPGPLNMSQPYHLLIPLQLNNDITYHARAWNYTENKNMFLMDITGLGYVHIQFDLIQVSADNLTVCAIKEQRYNITAHREQRAVDMGFNVAITILGIMNIFGLGCVSDMGAVKEQLKKPLPISLACLTQYILTPLLTFGLAKLLSVQNEIAMGLLFCACVPGGGLGHLIVVVLGDANKNLSVALNFLQLVVVLGTAPAWVFSMGQFFPNGEGKVQPTLYLTVLWLAGLVIPYSMGTIVRHFRESASEAILNWLVKPMLLLAFILFITLGLYINMYAFGVMGKRAIIVGTMIPFLGFGIGGLLTLVCKQGKPVAKTVATEAAVMNCITVIVAIRFTMPQPDADMATAGALWVFFASPAPFILMLIFHKIKKKIMSYFEKREAEKEQQETMLHSFATITQNALQISGMTPDQVALRKTDEERENGDRTLLIGRESQSSTVSVSTDEPVQSMVKLIGSQHNITQSVETIPMNQTNSVTKSYV